MDKDGKDSRAIHDRYAEIGNTLIDCLVDAQELPGFTVVNCIKTIYLFVSAHPPIISTQQAATLLPYLKNSTTVRFCFTFLTLSHVLTIELHLRLKNKLRLIIY